MQAWFLSQARRIVLVEAMIGPMQPLGITYTDRALLASEWAGRDDMGYALCPNCRAPASRANGGPMTDLSARTSGKHLPSCVHDAALAERGYPDQDSRDRMRAALSRVTEPAPPPESTL